MQFCYRFEVSESFDEWRYPATMMQPQTLQWDAQMPKDLRKREEKRWPS